LVLYKGDSMKYFVAILVIALGVAAIVYGGADDSPGGQLIGVLLIVGAVAVVVRMVRRNR
jgi:drug/metabolite transporter (DMT)-like permease